MTRLDIQSSELHIVEQILAQHVPEHDVCAFGSRVTGKARKTSDLDLAIMAQSSLGASRFADLRDAFIESDLPFKVDIVDWSGISENFRKIIQKDCLKIQNGAAKP